MIVLDTESSILILHAKTLFGRSKKYAINFAELAIEVDRNKRSIYDIAFLKNKMEVFKISNSKDGMTQSQLEEFAAAAESLGIAVRNF